MTRTHSCLAGLACSLVLPACTTVPRAAVIEPVKIEDAVFSGRGPKFAPGLHAMVRICVAPQGLVSSVAVVLSSGDRRFDDYVLGFARRVSVQPQRINGRAVAACDTVRVEFNRSVAPSFSAGSRSAFG